MTKLLILDSGPLISLTLNGLLDVFKNLKNKFPEIKFIVTPQVKREVIDRPSKIKKYELESIKISNLLESGIVNLSSDFVSNREVEKETANILRQANSIFKSFGQTISPIQEGEASCLAFSKLCGVENLIVIDERTTRLISESPESLRTLMERKVHTRLEFNANGLKDFKKFRYIRSSELLFIAYKNDLLGLKKDKQVLDAILYSVKFSGAAVSSKEIEEMKGLA
jgi:predicted nucleic acid-binding protein